jgi:AcrR family transcriptional regulator
MRDQILETSLRQFLLKGIRKITVKEIIAPLGISTKTVYKYFESKEALLEKCLELHYSTVYAELISTTNEVSNPLILLFQLFKKGIELDFKANILFYHDLNYYYPELQDKVIGKSNESFEMPLKRAFQSGIEQGYIRDGIRTEVIIEGISLFYRALTRTGQFQKFNLSPFELAANTLEIYLRGLCTAKGLLEIENNIQLTSFNYKN